MLRILGRQAAGQIGLRTAAPHRFSAYQASLLVNAVRQHQRYQSQAIRSPSLPAISPSEAVPVLKPSRYISEYRGFFEVTDKAITLLSKFLRLCAASTFVLMLAVLLRYETVSASSHLHVLYLNATMLR